MLKKKYCDFHTHTTLSDGALTEEQLIEKAIENNIGVLAITDHNRMMNQEKFLALREKYKDQIQLLRAVEVTCKHPVGGRNVELHVVVWFPEETLVTTFQERILANNFKNDRRPYIEKILAKLFEGGVDLGGYEGLQKMFPEKDYFGRPQIAEAMMRKGYVETCSEAFDKWIGDFGERKAYVKNPNNDHYCSLKELVEAAIACRGIPVLCHLFYYLLTEEEERILVKDFAEMTKGIGCMETDYRIYDKEQRRKLKALAEEFGLVPSAASDYHAIFDTDGLDNHFPMIFYIRMLSAWVNYYYGGENNENLD